MPEARYAHAACVVGDAIYVGGGLTPSSERTDTLYKYETVANEWSTCAPMPEARAYHAACALGGMLFVAGGYVNRSSVVRYDPPGHVERDGGHGNWQSRFRLVCTAASYTQ